MLRVSLRGARLSVSLPPTPGGAHTGVFVPHRPHYKAGPVAGPGTAELISGEPSLLANRA